MLSVRRSAYKYNYTLAFSPARRLMGVLQRLYPPKNCAYKTVKSPFHLLCQPFQFNHPVQSSSAIQLKSPGLPPCAWIRLSSLSRKSASLIRSRRLSPNHCQGRRSQGSISRLSRCANPASVAVPFLFQPSRRAVTTDAISGSYSALVPPFSLATPQSPNTGQIPNIENRVQLLWQAFLPFRAGGGQPERAEGKAPPP